MNEQTRKKDWFTDQYEKVIGKPLPHRELTTDEVIKRLKDSAKYRRISEAKLYKNPVPETGTVHYLKWIDPQIKKCTCPDRDCTCRGGFILPRKKIPRGERYIKSPLGRKLVQCFRKPVAPPKQSFMQRLADVIGVEATIYKDLESKGVLNIRGAEFCTSRCIRYYGPGHSPISSSLLDIQKANRIKMQSPDNDTDEDCRLCDDYTCTVSTQSTVGPEGEFVIGNFSHILFGSPDETVVKDIEGTKLHISSYKYINTNSHYATDNPCSLDKLLSWREFVNFRQLKNHLSLLKQNIYSSIFEIKDTNSSVRNLTTQCQEECTNKKSSEKISIPTPYKGVVIKVRKEPQEGRSSDQVQQETLQIRTQIDDKILNTVNKQGNRRDLRNNLKYKDSMPIIKDDKSLHMDTIHRQSQIEFAECKKREDSLLNVQKQEPSLIQNENTSDNLVKDKTIKEMNFSNKELKMKGQLPLISNENELNFNIKKFVNTDNDKENIERYSINLNNFDGNDAKSKDVLGETVMPAKSQNIANLSEHVVENRQNLELPIQQLIKNRLSEANKNLEEYRNEFMGTSKDTKIVKQEHEECSKCHIGNFFKKRLYKLSLEHLPKLKTDKFTKSFYYSANNHEIRTNSGKSVLDPEVKNKTEMHRCIVKKTSNDNIQLNSKLSDDLSIFQNKTTKSQLQLLSLNARETNPQQDLLLLSTMSRIPLMHEQVKSLNIELTSVRENTNNYLGKPGELTELSTTEKFTCKLYEKSENLMNSIYEVVTTTDQKVNVNSISTDNYCKTEKILENDETRLTQMEINSKFQCNRQSEQILLNNSHQEGNKSIFNNSLVINNKISKEGLKKDPFITKKISNMSFQLKKLIWRKIKIIKSLPEQTLPKCFGKSSNTRGVISAINCKGCNTSHEKKNREEPKSSEKEVFSIQYSTLLGEIQEN